MPTAKYNTSDYLKSNEDITEYLNAALEENDPEIFLIALDNVIKATRSVTQTTKETKTSQEESMYLMLSEKGHLGIGKLLKIFNQLGIKLACSA
jgi:probable addiction module antidote protein